jgi:hypothetical protein
LFCFYSVRRTYYLPVRHTLARFFFHWTELPVQQPLVLAEPLQPEAHIPEPLEQKKDLLGLVECDWRTHWRTLEAPPVRQEKLVLLGQLLVSWP